MTTEQKMNKIAGYVLFHISKGMSNTEAIAQVSGGLGISTDAVKLAVTGILS